MTNNLTLGHCPTPTSRHNGFWGHVPQLYSLAWKPDHIPLQKDKQELCTALSHYHLVGTKHFFPQSKLPICLLRLKGFQLQLLLTTNGQSGGFMVAPQLVQQAMLAPARRLLDYHHSNSNLHWTLGLFNRRPTGITINAWKCQPPPPNSFAWNALFKSTVTQSPRLTPSPKLSRSFWDSWL